MIKKLWAKITKKGDEAGQYPIQQATYLGRVADFFTLFPYGMHANLPPDQLGLVIDEQGRIFMASSAIGRIAVEEGEVVFFHPTTKAKIHFKAAGDLDIDTVNPDVEDTLHGNVNINTKNANITTSEKTVVNSTGDVDIITTGNANIDAVDANITASGDVNVKATNVNVDATATNLGVGGSAIARVGDAVLVGGVPGVITSGGLNTSI